MSVAIQIRKQIDNIAAYREVLTQASVGRYLLWDLAYPTDDETYLNIVLNQTLTNVDKALNNVSIGNALVGNWMALHNTYLQSIGVTVATNQHGYLDAWIATQRWRPSQYFNRVFYEITGQYLTLSNVFPRDDFVLATYTQVGSTFTAVTAIDATQAGLGAIQAVVPVGTTIGSSSFAITPTATKSTGTGLVLAATTITNGSIAGTSFPLGQQALTGTAANGQAVIGVAATAQFVVGEYALLADNQGNQEIIQVLSVVSNTSVTATSNLINGSYTTANSSKLTPLFAGITACTSTGGTSGDQVQFKIYPDRVVSITAGP